MAGIQLKNITKIFDKIEAVKNVTLDINDQEFMVLVGPSGCGKSTLLRLIAGLEDITSGELYIGELLVNQLSPKDRDIAIVFQNYALYPHMTAYNNLAFGLKIKKMKKHDIDQRVMKAAEILEIKDLLQRKPRAMSGGQRQRVAIGRAIVREPKVFLFDEPLSNLDAKLRGQMRIEIANLHKRLKTTIVYVTHDQAEAMTLGDRIAVMHKGEIQQIDTPANLYMHPVNLMVAGFIGTPPMNFLEGHVFKKNGTWIFKATDLPFETSLHMNWKEINSNNKVILGIRPEHVHADRKEYLNEPGVLKTQIDFIENLGYEYFAYCHPQSKSFISRFEKPPSIETGVSIDLFLDTSKMLFFDKYSGKLIG